MKWELAKVVSGGRDRGLSSALAELWHVEAASVLVVRAHEGKPLDLWQTADYRP